jgi:hypothetical protein
MEGMSLVVCEMVNPSNTKMDYLPNRVTMPHQTWLIGNTFSDVLIATTMLYYVRPFLLLYMLVIRN